MASMNFAFLASTNAKLAQQPQQHAPLAMLQPLELYQVLIALVSKAIMIILLSFA